MHYVRVSKKVLKIKKFGIRTHLIPFLISFFCVTCLCVFTALIITMTSSYAESTSMVPKQLEDLQNLLSSHDCKRPIAEDGDAHSSLTKKRRLRSDTFNTPETTPIHKGSKISVISPASADQKGVKKLDFTEHVQIKKEASHVKVEEQLTVEIPTPPVTPQKDEENKENVVPTSKPQSIYLRAKATFQRSSPVKFSSVLPERNVEANALKNFFMSHIKEGQTSSLYVSGPPGTGKTAQLNLTLSEFIDMESTEKLQQVEIDGKDYTLGYSYINCMTVSKTSNIYSEIYTALTGEKVHIKQSRDQLQSFLSSDKAHMSIIILDELDQLLGKQNDEVFTLFSWALNCNIILVGISNALDMVDRLLPRLKMNGLSPNTLVFMPYTADQIARIIKAKIETIEMESHELGFELFHPAAIQLCARKSASNTGDLRKAFDICRCAIELVERETRGLNILKDRGDKQLQSVKIQHIARVINTVFNTNQMSKLRELNLQQKLLVCLLIKAEGANPFQTLTMNAFYEYYIKNGKVDNLVGLLKKAEFLEALSSLEANSVVRVNKSPRAFSESKISSSVVKKDLASVIKGIYILEKLMADSGLLAN